MIAADTSSLVAFFDDQEGKDVLLIDKALSDGLLVIIPPVLTEILSDPKIPSKLEDFLMGIYNQNIKPGFWFRAGKLRSEIIKKKKKAKMADILIAQFCLDHNYSLITRDSDFNTIQKFSELILL